MPCHPPGQKVPLLIPRCSCLPRAASSSYSFILSSPSFHPQITFLRPLSSSPFIFFQCLHFISSGLSLLRRMSASSKPLFLPLPYYFLASTHLLSFSNPHSTSLYFPTPTLASTPELPLLLHSPTPHHRCFHHLLYMPPLPSPSPTSNPSFSFHPSSLHSSSSLTFSPLPFCLPFPFLPPTAHFPPILLA